MNRYLEKVGFILLIALLLSSGVIIDSINTRGVSVSDVINQVEKTTKNKVTIHQKSHTIDTAQEHDTLGIWKFVNGVDFDRARIQNYTIALRRLPDNGVNIMNLKKRISQLSRLRYILGKRTEDVRERRRLGRELNDCYENCDLNDKQRIYIENQGLFKAYKRYKTNKN